MVRLGYLDAVRTPTGADGGIDVRALTAIAQVKRTASRVGRPDVQRLAGARGSRGHLSLVFYSKSGYTREAGLSAEELHMALFVYDEAGRVASCNRWAAKLEASARARRIRNRRKARVVRRGDYLAASLLTVIAGVLLVLERSEQPLSMWAIFLASAVVFLSINLLVAATWTRDLLRSLKSELDHHCEDLDSVTDARYLDSVNPARGTMNMWPFVRTGALSDIDGSSDEHA